MGWLISAAGLVVVVLGLRDIFHTLWHPGGAGWTLVYSPHMPEGLHFGSALSPDQSSDPVAALHRGTAPG